MRRDDLSRSARSQNLNYAQEVVVLFDLNYIPGESGAKYPICTSFEHAGGRCESNIGEKDDLCRLFCQLVSSL